MKANIAEEFGKSLKVIILIFIIIIAVLSVVAQEKPPAQVAIASWYCLQSKQMANGQKMKCEWMTAASNVLPLGTLIFITNPENGRSVYAIVTDRGPFVEPRDLDVSLGVAKKLDFVKKGVANLLIRVVSGQLPCKDNN
jgi:rare lipoprotein A (peptidoglycan hydrolase)